MKGTVNVTRERYSYCICRGMKYSCVCVVES